MANALAYGFVSLDSVLADRVSNIGERIVLDAVRESATEHTRALNSMLSTFIERTTLAKDLVQQVGGGEMQPLDAFGNPLPIPMTAPISVGYPISGGGTAWASNRVSRAYMTGADANKLTIEAMGRDLRTLRRKLLAAIFDNVSYNYYDEVFKLGNVAILPLANSDTQTYVRVGGGAAAVDEHYLAQAAAIADATNPFPTIYTELAEHPGNGTEVACYVPSNLVASIEALGDFVPVRDAFIQPAMTSATLPPASQLSRILGPGDIVIGRVSKCWIVEWKALPDSYIVAQALAAGAVLAMREHVPAQLQGLFIENNSPDGNIMETRMIRYCGFGVMKRVAALVMRIGDAAYAIPTGYDAPLAI